MAELGTIDRRQKRTREAIRQAFISLATNRRYDDFSVRDLIERADIGRSTFYEHYRSKDDVLRALMDGMLIELADASGGLVPVDKLCGLLNHFWGNRRLGKVVFGPPLAPTVRRRLADLIEQRTSAGRARATFLAAGQIGLLHAWLSGEFPGEPEAIAPVLVNATRD
jgi:AcrR family transcriptional regulator